MKNYVDIIFEAVQVRKEKGIWKFGRVDDYKFEAMVFEEPSEEFGINGGRISKLFLKNKEGELVGSYERRPDIVPKGKDKKVWDEIVKFFE